MHKALGSNPTSTYNEQVFTFGSVLSSPWDSKSLGTSMFTQCDTFPTS